MDLLNFLGTMGESPIPIVAAFFLGLMTAISPCPLGATAPFPGTGYGHAIPAEEIGTFVLMLVIMGVAVDERAPSVFTELIICLNVGAGSCGYLPGIDHYGFSMI